MKLTITRFNDKTGDFEITIPVPFTLKDVIEYADMIVVDIPKYEDTKDYNVFDLIRENQDLKKQLEESINSYTEENALRHKMSLDLNTVKTKQKEFIEWLERKVKKYTPNLRVNVFDEYGNRIAQYINAEVYEIPPEDVVKEVLSKYKEIIGGSND